MGEWSIEEKQAFDQRMAEAFTRAHGQWRELLVALGVPETIVNGKNQPCPVCKDGEDRFQFTDKYAMGNYVCRHCGPGGGINLLMAVRGWKAGQALREMERYLAMPAAQQPATGKRERNRVEIDKANQRIWNECKPIRRGDPVDRYLRALGLGIDIYPPDLRCHLRLPYYEEEGVGAKRMVKVGEFAAMVARITMPDDSMCGLHRTYLKDGAKAPVPKPKKVTNGGYEGGAVRLAEARDDTLATSEGIENGLAVMVRRGLPTWPALNAWNLKRVWVPDHVRRLKIYGDNDADGGFDGQLAAYTRAYDFVRSGTPDHRRFADVYIPKKPGSDWKEVLQQRGRRVEGPRADPRRLRAG